MFGASNAAAIVARVRRHLGHLAHKPADPREAPPNATFALTTPAHVGFDEYYTTAPQAEISTTFNCGCLEGDPNGTQCIWGHWREGKDANLPKPHCDRMYVKNGSSADDVGFDPTPMVRGGYGADNAELLVDQFAAFVNKTLLAKQNFLGAIWSVMRHRAQPLSRSTLKSRLTRWLAGSLAHIQYSVTLSCADSLLRR